MKIRQVTPVTSKRSRLGRLALGSTLVCGLGLAAPTVHGQEIGGNVGGEAGAQAGATVDDQLSPGSGQDAVDGRDAARRGIREGARSLGEGRSIGESAQRGAREAARGAGDAISGQRAQDRTLYRDDQGRTFYRDDQGRQVYTERQGQPRAFTERQGQQGATVQGQQGATVQGQSRAGTNIRGDQAGARDRASLGVAIQDSQQGVEVVDVQSDSAASAAGLQQGDVILRVDGQPVQNSSALGQRIGSMTPNQQIGMTVLRNGQEQDIAATLQQDQRYSAARPAMRGGAQGELSGIRQQVEQLQQDIQSLRQQMDRIQADGDARTQTEGEATGRSELQSDLPDQEGQSQDERDLESDLESDVETDLEADSTRPGQQDRGQDELDVDAELESDAGAGQSDAQDNQPNAQGEQQSGAQGGLQLQGDNDSQ